MRPLTVFAVTTLFCILTLVLSVDARRHRKQNRDKSVDNLEEEREIVEDDEESSTSQAKKSLTKDSHSNGDRDSFASADAEEKEPQENNQPYTGPFNEEEQANGNRSRSRGLVRPGIQLFRRKTRKPLPTPNISAILKPTLPSFLSRSKSKTSAQTDSPEEEKENTSQSSETKSDESQVTTSHRQRPEAPGRRRKRPRNKGRFSRRRRLEARTDE
ncbi:uncharacterized protein LOC111086586 [Limulus polyphemus]|uniref:Uncharacterized protein LOC111086586 n=1 Tax=Limulus polyphemus TaxID=6850 RepID=A0ABM1SPW6_LIMPO|nr:uncharacterized protein LOC111086586 [Limulus polyphemus]